MKIDSTISFTLTKTAEKNPSPDNKIFLGYTAEGFLFSTEDKPRLGHPFTFFRTKRNDVDCLGLFMNSIVVGIGENTDEEGNVIATIIETSNSFYSLVYHPESDSPSPA